MPITARDLIQRSMLRAGLVARGEVPTAEETDDGLKALNEMLHAWETDGIHIGHTDLKVDDTVQLPESHVRGTRLLLAVELLDEYEKEAMPLLVGQADRAKRQLLAEYITVPDAKIDQTLLDMDANRQRRRFDINEG